MPRTLVHASALAVAALVLAAAGQPIFTDDLWWHLAYGRAFLRHGPWLAEDPLLFAAAGPPLRGSWLADIGLARLSETVGWTGLRVLHAGLVAAILALAWRALRRAGASAAFASLATAVFAVLAAHRLVQLRPELLSILFGLLVYRWLVADGRPPSWRRVAAAGALAALWANVHAAFPLGPLLVAAASVGLLLAAPLRAPARRAADRARAVRLAAAAAILGLATLANPTGLGAHLAYFAAGGETPALERVVDEWAPVSPFAWPRPPQLPSPLSWAIVWTIGLAIAAALGRDLARRGAGARDRLHDPALAGIAALSIALLLSAVRFLWLGLFPLLWLASRAGARIAPDGPGDASAAGRRAAWLAAAAAVALVPGFLHRGDWPAITRGLPRTAAGYAQPYPLAKYHAHAIWLLRDTGARGHLYQDYFLGGFAGYWLAPELRSLVNGTLNVRRGTIDALAAVAGRRGERAGEDFPALLDRLDLDLFLGIRLPMAGGPGRPAAATTGHLEDTPGWIPVFRNPECALYLRASERNRENLERFARHYAERGVPFDRERGFDAAAVSDAAPTWAVAHGVVPRGFARTALRARSGRDPRAADAVATVYALLGAYARAAELDRALLDRDPDDVRARRRLAWSLLRSGQLDEARAVAEPLAAAPAGDGLSHAIADAARAASELDPDERRAAAAALPLLSHAEASWIAGHLVRPAHRPPRD